METDVAPLGADLENKQTLVGQRLPSEASVVVLVLARLTVSLRTVAFTTCTCLAITPTRDEDKNQAYAGVFFLRHQESSNISQSRGGGSPPELCSDRRTVRRGSLWLGVRDGACLLVRRLSLGKESHGCALCDGPTPFSRGSRRSNFRRSLHDSHWHSTRTDSHGRNE